MQDFNTLKKKALSKRDLSRKGGIDEEILGLVNKINDSDDYFTTSSCAGRIVLLELGEKKKLDSRWILASHKQITFPELKNSLKDKTEKELWFKQESWILHVCCRNIECAEELLKICKKTGLKRAGITSLNPKIMIEIMSTESISLPIGENNELFFDDSALSYLVERANKNMILNRKRMDDFKDNIFSS